MPFVWKQLDISEKESSKYAKKSAYLFLCIFLLFNYRFNYFRQSSDRAQLVISQQAL